MPLVSPVLVLGGPCLVDTRVLLLPHNDGLLSLEEVFILARACVQKAGQERSVVLVLGHGVHSMIARDRVGQVISLAFAHRLIFLAVSRPAIQLIILAQRCLALIVLGNGLRVGEGAHTLRCVVLLIVFCRLRVRLIIVEVKFATGVLLHPLILLILTALEVVSCITGDINDWLKLADALGVFCTLASGWKPVCPALLWLGVGQSLLFGAFTTWLIGPVI